MKRKLLLGTLVMAGAGALVGQRPPQSAPVLMQDDGAVASAQATVHRKVGETVSWGRQTAGQRTWYVRFAESPCAEGAEFGHDRQMTCTIRVACAKTGDPACKAYNYSSALSAGGAMHDPGVIVDPSS
jgi:hypothetical protein